MEVVITLPDDLMVELRSEAARLGCTVEAYIAKQLTARKRLADLQRLRQGLAPVYSPVDTLTDEEIFEQVS